LRKPNRVQIERCGFLPDGSEEQLPLHSVLGFHHFGQFRALLDNAEDVRSREPKKSIGLLDRMENDRFLLEDHLKNVIICRKRVRKPRRTAYSAGNETIDRHTVLYDPALHLIYPFEVWA
jgi:hypothetical protein